MPQKVGASIALVVPVSINGSKTTWWIVDTGTPICIIDPPFSRTLGLQTDRNVGGLPLAPLNDPDKESGYSFGDATDFKLASYDAKGARLGFTSLNLPNPGSTHRFAGFLGMDFLFYRSAIIDVGGRALYLKTISRPR